MANTKKFAAEYKSDYIKAIKALDAVKFKIQQRTKDILKANPHAEVIKKSYFYNHILDKDNLSDDNVQILLAVIKDIETENSKKNKLKQLDIFENE